MRDHRADYHTQLPNGYGRGLSSKAQKSSMMKMVLLLTVMMNMMSP